jgi:hypothetical protein
MDLILEASSKIYDQFHIRGARPEHFFGDECASAFAAYYTAMYLIQDSGEAVSAHMQRGFSSGPLIKYIEFWGVMQAIFIQQDAIKELCTAVIGSWSEPEKDTAWWKIRDVRNLCAGHPAERGGQKKRKGDDCPLPQRTFMGRSFGDYNRIQYELWDARTPNQPSHPEFSLGAMIKQYDVEAARTLKGVLDAMNAKWRSVGSDISAGHP